jgi:hypothetical protein
VVSFFLVSHSSSFIAPFLFESLKNNGTVISNLVERFKFKSQLKFSSRFCAPARFSLHKVFLEFWGRPTMDERHALRATTLTCSGARFLHFSRQPTTTTTTTTTNVLPSFLYSSTPNNYTPESKRKKSKMQLPDGCYPRLNAALLRSGKFDGMVVSMVGKVLPDGSGFFLCCDQGRIRLDGDQGMIPSDLAATDMVIEVMGLAVDAETVSVRVRFRF